MTLDELRAFDIPAAWAGLAPDRQNAIGEAGIAFQLARLVEDTTVQPDEMTEADAMANEAYAVAVEAVEQALPDIPWRG